MAHLGHGLPEQRAPRRLRHRLQLHFVAHILKLHTDAHICFTAGLTESVCGYRLFGESAQACLQDDGKRCCGADGGGLAPLRRIDSELLAVCQIEAGLGYDSRLGDVEARPRRGKVPQDLQMVCCFPSTDVDFDLQLPAVAVLVPTCCFTRRSTLHTAVELLRRRRRCCNCRRSFAPPTHTLLVLLHQCRSRVTAAFNSPI